jgi:hypothetical protein
LAFAIWGWLELGKVSPAEPASGYFAAERRSDHKRRRKLDDIVGPWLEPGGLTQ